MRSHRTLCLILFSAAAAVFFVPRDLFCAGGRETGPAPIYCESDYLSYSREEGVAECWGSVGVRYKDIEIFSDYLNVNMDSESLFASGNISFLSRSGTINGDSVIYSIRKEKGVVENASTSMPPLYYRGKKIEKVSDSELSVDRGLCTTCELETPHYRLQASRITIYPQERIVAFNVGLFLGPVPVFYLPMLTFPLKKGRVSWLVPTVGYSGDKGFYVQAGYDYSYKRYVSGNVFGEYMQLKGYGVGSELEYDVHKYAGIASLYYFRENSGSDRYKTDIRMQPAGSNSFVYLYLLSDAYFDQEFGPYFGPPASWIKRKATAYVSYSRPLKNDLNFQADLKGEMSKEGTYISLPSLSLYSRQSRAGRAPFYTDLSFRAGNYLINSNRYFFSDNRFNVTPDPLRITKRLSIVSGAGIQGAYHEVSGFLPGYMFRAGPRLKFGGHFMSELTYNVDSLVQDNTSLLAVPPPRLRVPGQYMRAVISYSDRMTGVELSGNYDLLSRESVWDRFYKARLDIMVNPSGRVRFFSSTKYHVYEKTTQNLSYVQWCGSSLNASFGTQYYYGTGPQLNLISVLDFLKVMNVPGDFRFTVSCSYDVISPPKGRLNSKFDAVDLVLTKDLTDCWSGTCFYRLIPNEIWFQVGIKAFPGVGLQFYPNVF